MHSLHFLSLLLLMTSISYSVTSLTTQKTNLTLLNVIFRHGDRTPDEGLVKGNLTEKGLQRAHKLGLQLRKRYKDFLGKKYNPYHVRGRSSSYTRTQESLKRVLAGLYPKVKSDYWNQMNVFSVETNQDALLGMFNCPRVQTEIQRTFYTPEFQKLLQPYQEFMKNLSLFSGTKLTDDQEVANYYQNLKCIESMDEPNVPEWLGSLLDNEQLYNLTLLGYNHYRYNLFLQKLNGGALMRKMIENMVLKLYLNFQQKLYLYSGHDINIHNILQVLELWNGTLPAFTSAIIIELREGYDGYYISIVHYKGIPSEFEVLQVPGCPTPCPIQKFIDLVTSQLPELEEIVCSSQAVVWT